MFARQIAAIGAAISLSCAWASPALAFTVPVHKDITVKELKEVHASVRGHSQGFSDKALGQLAAANGAIDDGGSMARWHPERHFTNERFADTTTYIGQQRDAALEALAGDNPDGDKARVAIGSALHAIQDFYSHSTWVESGNTSINSNLGRATLANPPTSLQVCPDHRNNGLATDQGVTSAYYEGDLGCNAIPAGKCFHGNWVIPNLITGCPDDGINKDRPVTTLHAEARALAEEATRDFVEGIFTALAGKDIALSALLDLKGSLGFVIDNTGSMGSTIGGVRLIAQAFVATASLFPATTPDQWILETFNDPTIGVPFVTQDPQAMSNAIGAVSVFGGGDCPELSQAGILAALGHVTPNSRLFVFTDASAKDSARVNEVIALAQARKTHVNTFATSSCSPVDPAYERAAAETGGQLFLVNSSQTAQLQPLIESQLTGDLVSIATKRGVLATGTSQQLEFPVDSSLSRLVVSVIAPPATVVSLVRPNGTLVNVGDAGAQVVDLAPGAFTTPARTKFYSLQAPAVGSWRVQVSGAGDYVITATGNSELDVSSVEFVRPGTDLHGGLFAIAGQPIAGSSVTAVAALTGRFQSANFGFTDETGASFGGVALANDPARVGPSEFVGSFTLPSVPFRVRVTGFDASSNPYERQYPVVFRGQSVGVEVSGDSTSYLPTGIATTFVFNVRNTGAAANFSIKAASTQGFAVTTSPTTLTLAASASSPVRVTVLAPSATATGIEDLLTVTATNAANPTAFNSASMALIASGSGIPGDVDGNGSVTCQDMQIVRQAFGARANQVGFDPRADLNRDTTIDVRDLSIVARQLPAGTKCN